MIYLIEIHDIFDSASREHEHRMVYTCLECGTSRRIPAPRNGLMTRAEDPTLDTSASMDIDQPAQLDPTSNDLQQQCQEQRKEKSTGVLMERKEDIMSAQLSIPRGEVKKSIQEEKSVKEVVKKKKEKKEKKEKEKLKLKLKSRLAKRKKRIPREPPLFARKDVGHVVYRGDEEVDMEGVYCV